MSLFAVPGCLPRVSDGVLVDVAAEANRGRAIAATGISRHCSRAVTPKALTPETHCATTNQILADKVSAARRSSASQGRKMLNRFPR